MDISASNISLQLGAKEILKDVSLSAKDKTFLGLIGPNGSGKSTLLKCIYRILKPDEGAVYIDESNVNDMSYIESGKKIAVVSQQNSYNFDFVVKDFVIMGRSPHKKIMEPDNVLDFQIVDESLELVNMISYKDRYFSTLSGGEQQRIILARALTQKTPILILDELTNHLDIKFQLQLLETVRKLDKTVIGAFHDLNMAAMFCDKIAAIKDGKIIKYGNVNDVLTEETISEIYEVNSEVTKSESGDIINIRYYL